MILIMSLLFTTQLIAEDTWIKTYQPFGNVSYYPEDIVLCQDGGYAVNGHYIYNDPQFPPFEDEWGFLMKTDSDGNLLWAVRDTLDFMYWNRSHAFLETSDGSFISLGHSYGGGYMIKRDSEGNRLWSVPYNDFGTNSMDNTVEGNIILGGTQNLNIALRKIDEEGNTIWTKSYPIDDASSVCNSIIQTNDGGYVLTGYLDYQGNQDADILVMKTDVNGDSLWTKIYDGYGYWDRGLSVAEDSNNNIMVAGELRDYNYTIGFLWYLNENGNTIWIQEVDSDIGHSHSSITVLPDNTFTAYTYSGSGMNRETTIYNFDNNFDIIWVSELESNVAKGDKCISFLNNNHYIFALRDVGGIFQNNIGIAKTDSHGQVVSIDEFEVPFLNEIFLTNYPNPFNPSTTISFNIPEESVVKIEIFNLKGQRVNILIDDHLLPGEHKIIWDGDDDSGRQVSSGVYIFQLMVNDKTVATTKGLLLK